MAGKCPSSRPPPSKAGRAKPTPKARSSSQTKPKAGAPKIRTKTQKEAQKARDSSLKEGLNGDEAQLRELLMMRPEEEAKPLVKAQETPKELARGGDGLAGALMELEMAL